MKNKGRKKKRKQKAQPTKAAAQSAPSKDAPQAPPQQEKEASQETNTDAKKAETPDEASQAKAVASTPEKGPSESSKEADVPAKSDDKGLDTQDTQGEEVARQRRRAFLKQAAVVAGVAGAWSWASFAPPRWPLSLRDPDGERGKPKTPLIRLPEKGFVPTEKGNVLGIAHGTKMEAMVRAAIDAIGGIRRFIAKGDIVVIKPNVAFERPPALGATTNPALLKILIRIVKEAGAAEVRVADNPIESPESCFARSGIGRAVDVAKGKIYIPSHSDFQILNVPGAKLIEKWPFFWRPFIGANKVIGVAPVKDHNLCGASMTTKNWYGLLGGRRNQFHQDIHTIITDLALMMRPTFVLLDGSRVLFQSGPTGGSLDDVRPGNTIVAATDSLAADSFGWDELLRRKRKDKPGYFTQGAARKLGEPNWKQVPHKRIHLG